MFRLSVSTDTVEVKFSFALGIEKAGPEMVGVL